MLFGLAFVSFLMMLLLLPLKVESAIYRKIKQTYTLPLIVLMGSLSYIFLKEISLNLLPIFLILFSCYDNGGKILSRESLFESLFMISIFTLLAFLSAPTEYNFIFSLLYVVCKKFVTRSIDNLFLYIIILSLLLLSPLASWRTYFSLALIPLSFLLAFENNKDKLSQVNLLLLIVLIPTMSSEFFSSYYILVGFFLILISLFRDTDSLTMAYLISCGSYLSFYNHLSPMIVIPLLLIFIECRYLKKILFYEIKNLLKDNKKSSLGYQQITTLALILYIFSGLPLAPSSILYGISEMSLPMIFFLVLYDFPFLSLYALEDVKKSYSFKDEVIRITLFLGSILPLTWSIGSIIFYYQLIALLLTLIFGFYVKKNEEIEYHLKFIYQKLKFQFELYPGRKYTQREYPIKVDDRTALSIPTFRGVTNTVAFSLFSIISIAMIIWVAA